MRLGLPITVKLSALVVIMAMVTALSVNEVYLHGSNKILVEEAVNDLSQETEFFRYPLEGIINQLKDDAVLLSQMNATQSLMRAAQNNGVDPLNGMDNKSIEKSIVVNFREMLETRENYLKIKYVSVKGEELIKLERFGNNIAVASAAKLEKKVEEDYLKNSIQILPGQVYLSEARLVVENGKVETPHRLGLKAAVPIFTPEKEVFGIVLINADFGKILDDVKSNLLKDRVLYVTNNLGDYLINPDKTKLYAADLAHEKRIQTERPSILEAMGDDNFTSRTFVPEDKENGQVFSVLKYKYDTLDPSHYLFIALEAPYKEIINKTSSMERQGWLFSFLITTVAAILALIFLRILIKPLNRIADAVVRYRKGEENIALATDSPDEIGILSREFMDMMAQKGEEEWIKENLVNISKNLLGFKSLEIFAEALLKSMTPLVEAQVSVFYLSSSFLPKLIERDTEMLSLLATYGYKDNNTPKSFIWGEGLVGQCAKDREVRLITNIPDDYLLVSTSLGETKPRNLLLMPVVFENTLVGVLELASLNEFSAKHRKFLEQLRFNVGVITNSISASMRTQELLEEARTTTEELQRSEEELKTQQEELQASNEELEEKTKALEEQNLQIQNQTQQLEENKRAVEEKARELEMANKYKSEFLANMSHELRTPLNSLLILAKSLANNEEGNLTEEQIEETKIIHNGGLELLALINDILDLSKVEAGKISIITDDVLVDNLVRKMRQQFDPVAKESGIEFHVNLSGDLPKNIHTDGQRVEQILKNLLSNAFKFTENGSVTLEINPSKGDEVRRRSLRDQKVVSFSVKDTGIGIAKNKLQDIFEAFQQEDGSTDRHYGGTGLGLTIARKFAHLLGGEIHVESEKGKGSIFTLYLPEVIKVQRMPQPAIENPAHQNQDPTNTTALKSMPKSALKEFIPDDRDKIGENDRIMLIIEDDPTFAKTLMKISHKRGYKCIIAGDGKSGLLLASEEPVNGILLDLTLPDIDGMNVLDKLKHDLHTRHIPVHIITGREDANNVVPLRKGAIGCLTKPVNENDINKALVKIEILLDTTVKSVLVIEDDKKSQAAIKSLLRKKDIEITVVGRGKEALKRISEKTFDCVILDLRLPDMTGFEWLEQLEKERPDNTPPVIIYTAKDLSEEENRKLNQYTGSIIIKGANSSERLLDEVTLFLHSVESTLSKEQQDMIRMQHDPDKVLQGKKVLLVDDDLRNTFALSKMLKKHGMEVVVADNGQMAVEKLNEEKDVELIIMDIMMPIMDGYQAMREIRANKQIGNIPIIALTARAMPEEQDKCMQAGANDYLTKPVDIERLLSLMRVWLFKQEKAA